VLGENIGIYNITVFSENQRASYIGLPEWERGAGELPFLWEEMFWQPSRPESNECMEQSVPDRGFTLKTRVPLGYTVALQSTLRCYSGTLIGYILNTINQSIM
jgi:hypothetical protein